MKFLRTYLKISVYSFHCRQTHTRTPTNTFTKQLLKYLFYFAFVVLLVPLKVLEHFSVQFIGISLLPFQLLVRITDFFPTYSNKSPKRMRGQKINGGSIYFFMSYMLLPALSLNGV